MHAMETFRRHKKVLGTIHCIPLARLNTTAKHAVGELLALPNVSNGDFKCAGRIRFRNGSYATLEQAVTCFDFPCICINATTLFGK